MGLTVLVSWNNLIVFVHSTNIDCILGIVQGGTDDTLAQCLQNSIVERDHTGMRYVLGLGPGAMVIHIL